MDKHRQRPTYESINERMAAKIKELHDRYPDLGHRGLTQVLSQEGFRVDPKELKQFMRENHIRPRRPWPRLRLPGLPSWWIGGPPEP